MSLTLNRFHTLLVFLHCWLSMSKCSLGKCIILRSKFSIFNYNIFFFWKRSSHWWHVSVTEKMQCKVQKQPPKVFYKKGVLRNFAKFTWKQLCQSFFFNKVAGLRPATLLKKRAWHSCFPVNFVKFLRTRFYRASPDDCFRWYIDILRKAKEEILMFRKNEKIWKYWKETLLHLVWWTMNIE